MAGRGDPPEGGPEGLPGGGDDEYGSVDFDESFIRAARLREASAKERMKDHAHAVRRVPPPPPKRRSRHPFRNGPRRVLLLFLVIVLAFGTAVYLGLRNPYHPPIGGTAAQLRMAVVPLAPREPVPGGSPEDLFEHSPAAQFQEGPAGIALPPARETGDFSEGQVMAALTTVKDYLVASSMDPDVLTGHTVRPVRVLLEPDQFDQFDRSFSAPADDGRHAPAGWLVRFDPAKVASVGAVRARGTLRYEQSSTGMLEITSDHVFVYALRPAASAEQPGDQPVRDASLFTVRREMRFRFDVEDLIKRRTQVLSSEVLAGPQACSAQPPTTLRPLLAGERAKPDDPAGTDPYSTGPADTALCGTLARTAQPSPTARPSPRRPGPPA
ncbi:SCO2583 family membrane protein [Streptomyces sp. NPDC055025]